MKKKMYHIIQSVDAFVRTPPMHTSLSLDIVLGNCSATHVPTVSANASLEIVPHDDALHEKDAFFHHRGRCYQILAYRSPSVR